MDIVPLNPDVIKYSHETLDDILIKLLYLQKQSKFSHWNVKGILFIPIHKLFDDVFDVATSSSDKVAERIAQLGMIVSEEPEKLDDEIKTTADMSIHISLLIGSLTELSKTLHYGIINRQDHDPVTADILTGICTDIDKLLWFVKSISAS